MPASSYRFADFVLTTRPLELSRGGEPSKLAPQPTRLLELLLSRAGRLVRREEIREVLWGGDVYVDYERGINYNVRQIRAALKDDVAHPSFVETVPRHGYRFVAPVTVAAGPGEENRPRNLGRPRRLPRPVWIVLALLLAALTTTVLSVRERGPEGAGPAGDVRGTAGRLPPRAADDYRIGRLLLESPEPVDRRKAAEAFRRVLEEAPDFAPALSGLSRADLDPIDPEPARSAALRALELDPGLAEARLFLGRLAYRLELDLEAAGSSAETVLRQEPENGEALDLLLDVRLSEGRTEEAVELARRLLRVEPISLRGRWGMARALFQDRQFEASMEYAWASRELFRRRPVHPYELYIHSLIRLGRSDRAVEVARTYLALHGWDPPPVETLEDWWRFWLHHRGEPGDLPAPERRFRVAVWHLGLGEKEEALRLLKEACRLRSFADLRYLRTDPRLDPLRLEPGFQELLACLDPPPPDGRLLDGRASGGGSGAEDEAQG